jgi:hypothetical protein
MTDKDEKFVGIQISPISFIDEGVAPMLDMFDNRFGINTLLIGTISWLGLKVGRRISWEIEGWPDHGKPQPYALRGGSYIQHHPDYYRNTAVRNFQSDDPELEGKDILEMVIPEARKRGMKIYPEVMEPLFKYAGHGSANNVFIPNLPQMLEVDVFGRVSQEPCINHPDYRTWWHSIFEDYCRSYDIDGVMWCNERRSPIDNVLAGNPPNCFCKHCRHEAVERGIDVERVITAFKEFYKVVQKARAGEPFVDGALVELLRVIYYHPEILLWERYWVERNKDMDRELYGIVKWCNSELKFGLNVWNRNHFNPLRKAQWPWNEMATWSDWVKPITYQHQSGGIYANEMNMLHKSVLRDVSPEEFTPMMYKFLGMNEAPWNELVEKGLDPDTYVYGQCADAVRGVEGKVPVYMGIGVDAPVSSANQARCTPDIVRRSVLATYQAGGKGVVFSPSYAGMNLANLDGAAEALRELGLK